jgi:hypothetical protein
VSNVSATSERPGGGAKIGKGHLQSKPGRNPSLCLELRRGLVCSADPAPEGSRAPPRSAPSEPPGSDSPLTGPQLTPIMKNFFCSILSFRATAQRQINPSINTTRPQLIRYSQSILQSCEFSQAASLLYQNSDPKAPFRLGYPPRQGMDQVRLGRRAK